MTGEQKRFKILKRDSYEKQISQANKKATIYTFLLGLSAAAAIFMLSVTAVAARQNIDESKILAAKGLGLLNTYIGACKLKDLIQVICEKTMLKGKIEDINTELESPENEESRGMGR